MDPADLFRLHHVAVFRYALRSTGDRGAAEEIMQETFVRVVRHAATYDDRGRGRAWLFAIARNIVANGMRGRLRRPTEVLFDIASDGGDPTSNLLLQRLLAELPEPEREVLLLREVAGLDYEELALATASTVASVRSRLWRARSARGSSLTTATTIRSCTTSAKRRAAKAQETPHDTRPR